jgi:hypothetical protein
VDSGGRDRDKEERWTTVVTVGDTLTRDGGDGKQGSTCGTGHSGRGKTQAGKRQYNRGPSLPPSPPQIPRIRKRTGACGISMGEDIFTNLDGWGGRLRNSRWLGEQEHHYHFCRDVQGMGEGKGGGSVGLKLTTTGGTGGRRGGSSTFLQTPAGNTAIPDVLTRRSPPGSEGWWRGRRRG